MVNKIYIKLKIFFLPILCFLFCEINVVSQTEESFTFKNENIQISLIKFDSVFHVFKVEKDYHESFHLGKLKIKNDTLFFHELSDTFLVFNPRIFYSFDSQLKKNEVKLTARFDHLYRKNGQNLVDSINYVINDSISYKFNYDFIENYDEFHTIIIDLPLKIFKVKIETHYCYSDKLEIDLRDNSKHVNFNTIKLKFDYLSSSLFEPGKNLKSYIPEKINHGNNNYYFKYTSD